MDLKIEIPNTIEGYDLFMKCKSLPKYKVENGIVYTDKISYSSVFGDTEKNALSIKNDVLFDYQEFVVNKALEKKKYAAFLDCGHGKTLIQLMWCKAISEKKGKVLLLCPLAVLKEFYNDAKKFNIDVRISNLRNGDKWNEGIGILNYENHLDIDMSDVKGICLDESSILKNGQGATTNWLINLAKNIEYRLACSATPSPNEQAEYATHALFLGYTKTLLEFYGRFFRKDKNNWILKSWGVKPFYRFLSSWSIYIQNPCLLGFESGGYLSEKYELIKMYSDVDIKYIGNKLFTNSLDFKDRSNIFSKLRSDKSQKRFEDCVNAANNHKSIVWAYRNSEETALHKSIKNSVLITGKTPIEKRVEYIESFRENHISSIISKARILGWGVNLQQAEAHVYSGYNDSFEEWYQAIRRSHRYGRKGRLKVYVPITEPETPIMNNILRKEMTFENDCIELQKRFTNKLKT
jgi:hypothetical protein